jgi:N4-(beta-N-acetylglucosaminyl)-L-asparaginase
MVNIVFVLFLACSWCSACSESDNDFLPLVINTWPFVDANKEAAKLLVGGSSAVDAIEKGCNVCEMEQCDGSVGFGGSPDENGETTLDAMIMDGETHDVGSVGCLRGVKAAISVARSVMDHTSHTLLVGTLATNFAQEMGFTVESLETNKSKQMIEKWKTNNCQPNYWKPKSVLPDPTTHCGPYHSNTINNKNSNKHTVNRHNHDTIGMIAIDKDGKIACGTSTNGLTYKIPGRVGDSPVAGAGCYVERGVGGAAATGDGDIMMRFLPTYRVVQNMRNGMDPTVATREALDHISLYYPGYSGALVAVNISGSYGKGTLVGEYTRVHWYFMLFV